jgi:ABC-2 type transport system ATP-binding protein
MSDIAIKTEGLTKHYRNVEALTDLNLVIKQGTVFGFIGPNGAGKSTTIRILCGLHKATSGTAHVAGVEVTRHPSQVKSRVGYMPEDFGVYERMRVVEYLDFFAAAYGIPLRGRTEALDRAMALTGSTHMRDYFMGTLSRGMKQRVGIAKTLVHDPPVLILDEPTSGLDPNARIEVRQFLRKLKETGKTVLISSHILPELASVCDEVGIIHQGRLLACGPVDEIMEEARQELKIEVEMLCPARPVAMMIEAEPGVKDVEVKDNMVRFTYTGALEQVPLLHERLVRAGHKVLWMREVETDLETAFITITHGASAHRNE